MLHVVVAFLVALGMQSSKSFFSCFSVFGGRHCRFGGMLFSVQEPSKHQIGAFLRLSANVNKILIHHQEPIMLWAPDITELHFFDSLVN